MLSDYMCQEKKEEEYLPALKIALIHLLEDYIKSVDEYWLQQPETIQTMPGSTEQK